MIRRRTPKLRFGPTTTPCGFTSYNTASFSDLRPARIVRELVQNALDAAVEAGEATSIVRFKVTCIRSNEVPDIDGYGRAFRDAVRDQTRINGELSDASQQVAATIERALHNLSDDGYWCLSVLDNGVGLDAKRLNALLGDGTSFKASAATGSYGVGHFTSISASDLRYVLYGGVQKSGERIASGCAMLASRNNPQDHHLCAAQGYLVNRFKSGNDGTYDFMNAKSIPAIVNDCLTEIRRRWKHGSAIVIPAFNYFGDEQNRFLWNVISKITAYNFNAAIQHGRLVVEVDEDDVLQDADKMGVQRLDTETLRSVLKHESEHKRSARKKSFFDGLRPSGEHAYAAYLTLEEGDRDRMTTSAGDVDIRLRQPAPAGNTRVDLYRNGMWITNDIPYLKRADFPNRPPFHAVLLLDASANNEFHRLVRKAEGPMHNELALMRLAKNERSALKKALQDTAKWIKDRIPEVSTENYSPDDFLVVETGGEGPGRDAKPYAMWGAPVVIRKSGATQSSVATTISPPPGGSRSPTSKPSTPPGRTPRTASGSLSFTSTVVPDRKGRHVIVLECTEPVAEVLLSLRVDENTDVTCDRIWPDEDVPLRSCRIADESTATGQLTEDRRSIRLSGLSSGSAHRLTVEHAVPDELAETVRAPVFRVELRRLLHAGDEDADDS